MNKDWIDSLKYYAQLALAFILGYSVLALFLVVMAFFVLAIYKVRFHHDDLLFLLLLPSYVIQVS